MTDTNKLAELIKKAKSKMWGKTFHSELERNMFVADYLLVNGVIVPPCKVGDTIYRIDTKPKKCSKFNVYTSNEYYCADELNCYLYGTPCCDCGEEAYIFTIPNADIKAIVCNMDRLGKTVFLTKEEAEKALKERNNGTT